MFFYDIFVDSYWNCFVFSGFVFVVFIISICKLDVFLFLVFCVDYNLVLLG